MEKNGNLARGPPVTAPRRSDLEAAFLVLAALVWSEYPERYSLTEIARTWSGSSPEAIDALDRVERSYAGE